jgi:hypothetical protein
MQLFRRFLVVQALMSWQGGFLFYAAVVVPTGTDVLGSFEQGRVTRHVTDVMNAIGAVTLLVLAWDQWANAEPGWCRRARWAVWAVLAAGLVALAVVHPVVERLVDFGAEGRVHDYRAFYFWHRVYLYVSTAQWVGAIGYIALMLRAWGAKPHAA